MLGGRLLFDQAPDVLVGRIFKQRFRASPPAVIEGRPLLPDEAANDRIHGGARAEEGAGDLGGGATISSEQYDVHPQPPARLPFALHPDDEVLAFRGSDGDTLHGRPSLSWLVGFGVFTMQHRAAVSLFNYPVHLSSHAVPASASFSRASRVRE